MSGYVKCDRDYDYDRCCKKDYDWKKECGCSKCSKKKDYDVCKPLSPCPQKILLECGTPGGMMMFTSTGQTFTAANVSVDTSCFNKPIIDLQFTSQVNAMLDPTAGLFENTTVITQQQDAEVVLLYELICRRNGGSEITLGSWTFRRFLSGGSLTVPAGTTGFVTDAQDLSTYDTFSFSKCICSSPCPGCIDYFVRVTATTISQDANLVNNANATVSMGQLVAKIQDC